MGNLNIENEPNKKKKMIPREYQKYFMKRLKKKIQLYMQKLEEEKLLLL